MRNISTLIAIVSVLGLSYGQSMKVHTKGSATPASYSLSSIDSITFEIVTPSGMKLISSASKSFQMGLAGVAEPVHQVTFTKDFWMDSSGVTQGDYLSLMGVNPSGFAGDLKRPVEQTDWFDAVLYCNKRSNRDGKDTVYSYTGITGTAGNGCSLTGITINFAKNGYRLPTEAEREYACRAGTTTAYYWGRNYPPTTTADTSAIDNNAVWWHSGFSNTTAIVCSKMPNAFGLYDMSGNLWEWCNDLIGSYSSGSQTDPIGASSGSARAQRGGSWGVDDGSSSQYLCSAGRNGGNQPNFAATNRGFRCVLPQ